MESNAEPIFGHGKICYLMIPAVDIDMSVSFYKEVFGWRIREDDAGNISFDDGVGQVSGTWVTNRNPMSRELGILISIMVDDAQATVQSIITHGGSMVKEIGAEAPEITANFIDPAGNMLGIYQHRS
ncbi:MAG: VOC family protein [Ginsengibacter sp.]